MTKKINLGNNVRLKFTPYIFGEKAKFVKGKSVEKVISKSEFEAKFDTFIKGFISEYPKKSGISAKPNTQAQTQAPNNKKPAETKVNEENKKPAVQNDASKNEKNIKNNTEPQKTTNMEKAQDSIIDKNKKEDDIKGNAKTETPKNTNPSKGSHSYIKEFSAQRPKNLTFNFQYENEALSANKKLYVLDDYTPLGGGENGKRDKFGNRANQSEFGYLDKTFKDYINIPDRTIMVVDEQNDKYIKVKIDAYDNGIYYLKPSTGKYLKDAGITGEITRFIYVDRASQNEMVIEKTGDNWNVVTSSFVTTGKDSGSSFATPYGTFLIAYSKPVMQYTGSDNKTVVGDAKNAVRFSGGGYMHSIPSLFEPKNTREQRKAATAKKIGTYPESHKCIRHYDDQIKFIYDWLGNSTPGHKEGFRVPSVPTVMLVK